MKSVPIRIGISNTNVLRYPHIEFFGFIDEVFALRLHVFRFHKFSNIASIDLTDYIQLDNCTTIEESFLTHNKAYLFEVLQHECE